MNKALNKKNKAHQNSKTTEQMSKACLSIYIEVIQHWTVYVICKTGKVKMSIQNRDCLHFHLQQTNDLAQRWMTWQSQQKQMDYDLTILDQRPRWISCTLASVRRFLDVFPSCCKHTAHWGSPWGIAGKTKILEASVISTSQIIRTADIPLHSWFLIDEIAWKYGILSDFARSLEEIIKI